MSEEKDLNYGFESIDATNVIITATNSFAIFVDNVNIGPVQDAIVITNEPQTIDKMDKREGANPVGSVIIGGETKIACTLERPSMGVRILLSTTEAIDHMGRVMRGINRVGADLSKRRYPVRMVKMINGAPSNNPKDVMNFYAVEFKATGDLSLSPDAFATLGLEGMAHRPSEDLYDGNYEARYFDGDNKTTPLLEDGRQLPPVKFPIIPKITFDGEAIVIDFSNDDGITVNLNERMGELFSISQRDQDEREDVYEAKLDRIEDGVRAVIKPTDPSALNPNLPTRILSRRGAFFQSNTLPSMLLYQVVATKITKGDDAPLPPDGPNPPENGEEQEPVTRNARRGGN